LIHGETVVDREEADPPASSRSNLQRECYEWM
jgi:hypothetical protein